MARAAREAALLHRQGPKPETYPNAKPETSFVSAVSHLKLTTCRKPKQLHFGTRTPDSPGVSDPLLPRCSKPPGFKRARAEARCRSCREQYNRRKVHWGLPTRTFAFTPAAVAFTPASLSRSKSSPAVAGCGLARGVTPMSWPAVGANRDREVRVDNREVNPRQMCRLHPGLSL
jgi:hypothetical protein